MVQDVKVQHEDYQAGIVKDVLLLILDTHVIKVKQLLSFVGDEGNCIL